MAESSPIKDANNDVVQVAADTVSINGETVTVQRVKPGYGADGSFTDMDEKPATDASLDAIANLLALIADMLPRLTSNRQAAVAIESGSVGIAASQTLATLSDMQRVGGQYVNGNALQGAGLAVIYNNVEVT